MVGHRLCGLRRPNPSMGAGRGPPPKYRLANPGENMSASSVTLGIDQVTSGAVSGCLVCSATLGDAGRWTGYWRPTNIHWHCGDRYFSDGMYVFVLFCFQCCMS